MKTTYEDGRRQKIMVKGEAGSVNPHSKGLCKARLKRSSAIVGEWQMNLNMPARENIDKLTITKNADGTLAGKWEGRRGESKISNMKFEGGKLTFIRTWISEAR